MVSAGHTTGTAVSLNCQVLSQIHHLGWFQAAQTFRAAGTSIGLEMSHTGLHSQHRCHDSPSYISNIRLGCNILHNSGCTIWACTNLHYPSLALVIALQVCLNYTKSLDKHAHTRKVCDTALMHTASATTGKPQPSLTCANTECMTVNHCSALPASRSLLADSCTTGSAMIFILYSLANASLSHTAHRKLQSSYSGRRDLTEKGVSPLNPDLSDRLRANDDPLARPGKAAGIRALLMAALTCLSASGPPVQQLY